MSLPVHPWFAHIQAVREEVSGKRQITNLNQDDTALEIQIGVISGTDTVSEAEDDTSSDYSQDYPPNSTSYRDSEGRAYSPSPTNLEFLEAGKQPRSGANMPRKSNVSQVSVASVDEGTPTKERDGVNVEVSTLGKDNHVQIQRAD